MTAQVIRHTFAPQIYRILTEWDALHEALRDRVEDMDISRMELDAMSGLTLGYASKLLCDPPMKFVGPKTLPKILKGTRLKIALIEDNGQALPELPRRKYRIGRILAAPASIEPIIQETSISSDQLIRDHMRKIGAKGNMNGAASNGGKRRAKLMSKRARQRVASHAARMRWAKRTTA